eukprot:g3489.t1
MKRKRDSRGSPEPSGGPAGRRDRRGDGDRCFRLFGVSRAVLKAGALRQAPKVMGCSREDVQCAVRAVLEHRGLGRIGTASARHRDEIDEIVVELRAEYGGGEARLHASAGDPTPKMRETEHGDQQPSVSIPADVLESSLETLRSHGIARIPQVLSLRTVNALRNRLRQAIPQSAKTASSTRIVRLRDASGNGQNGVYFYLDPQVCGHDALKQLKKTLASALYETPRRRRAAIRSRCIGLGYSEGGINYTHQDQHELPYQALVMLSDPGCDFTGGELYVEVRERNGSPAPNYKPPLHCASNFAEGGAAGDVVLFCANSIEQSGKILECFHGMTRVRAGTRDLCERWAVGLFHGSM